jgi:hypothetical protein
MGAHCPAAGGFVSGIMTTAAIVEAVKTVSGLALASANIIGQDTCRHVIKDRMERAGMMWTLAGASALLRLRVVHTNDHWHEYQEFRIRREQKDLYGETAPHALAA